MVSNVPFTKLRLKPNKKMPCMGRATAWNVNYPILIMFYNGFEPRVSQSFKYENNNTKSLLKGHTGFFEWINVPCQSRYMFHENFFSYSIKHTLCYLSQVNDFSNLILSISNGLTLIYVAQWRQVTSLHDIGCFLVQILAFVKGIRYAFL